jgi:hypothetical protein
MARVFLIWLIGLCPTTSPVIIKSAPVMSINSFASLSIRILQSMHGFIFLPWPCAGFLTISINLSARWQSFTVKPNFSAAENGSFEHDDLSEISQPKCVRNVMAVTPIPCLSIVMIASVLSSPPEKRAIAFGFFILLSPS